MAHAQNASGYFCPECYRSDRIEIAATVWVRLTPDGSAADEATYGTGHEWTEDSEARCDACDWEGGVYELIDGEVPDYVVIEYDPDGPSPYKRKIHEEDGRPYVTLQVVAYHDGQDLPVDSLSDIDFFEDDADWVCGTYRSVAEIPERCEHLRDIAADMGLRRAWK